MLDRFGSPPRRRRELGTPSDAGRTWTVVSVPRQVNAIAFVDPLHGWAAGNAFFHTTDGRSNVNQTTIFGTIYDLFFLGHPAWMGLRQWLCELLYDRWRLALERGRSARRLDHEFDLFSPTCSMAGRLISTAKYFVLSMAAKSWTLKATVTGTNLQAIQFFDALEGWVIGGDAFYHTVNGGPKLDEDKRSGR